MGGSIALFGGTGEDQPRSCPLVVGICSVGGTTTPFSPAAPGKRFATSPVASLTTSTPSSEQQEKPKKKAIEPSHLRAAGFFFFVFRGAAFQLMLAARCGTGSRAPTVRGASTRTSSLGGGAAVFSFHQHFRNVEWGCARAGACHLRAGLN